MNRIFFYILWQLVYTYISFFMEWRTPLILPVSFGVKLNTIDPCWELLLCEQIMDLASGICHSAWQTLTSFCMVVLKNIISRQIAYLIFNAIPISNQCPSPFSSLLWHFEWHWSSWSSFDCIKDFHHQRTLCVWAAMIVLQQTQARTTFNHLLLIVTTYIFTNQQTLQDYSVHSISTFYNKL